MGYRDHCSVKVTAQGGPVTWRVTGTSGGLSARGGDTLSAGASEYVPVSRHDGICLGGGSGSVSFSPRGSASVSWNC
jgi:hypothetical protein